MTTGVTLAVKDNGLGIPEKFHDTVFEVFRRLHPQAAFEGSGIGLATCRRIVARHKGKIWVTSLEGTEAPFGFTFLSIKTPRTRPMRRCEMRSGPPNLSLGPFGLSFGHQAVAASDPVGWGPNIRFKGRDPVSRFSTLGRKDSIVGAKEDARLLVQNVKESAAVHEITDGAFYLRKVQLDT